MNRNGHVIWSEFILIVCLAGFLLLLLKGFGTWDVSVAIAWSVGLYIFGCTAPDLDHTKVQEKLHIKWVGRISKHRGHFHSLLGMSIYGGLCLIPLFIFKMVYWYFPFGSAMFGYFTHLFLDQIKKWVDRSQTRNTIRLW